MPIRKVKEKFKGSVVTIISTSVFTIIAVMMVAIVISFWMVESTSLDAQAINTSGSMRMQTYKIGLALQQQDLEHITRTINELDNTWTHHSLGAFIDTEDDSAIRDQFNYSKNNWENNLKPLIASIIEQPGHPFPTSQIQSQVENIDELVNLFQKHSEAKNHRLRLVLLISIFVSSFIGSIIFYILKERLERPLGLLTETAREMGKGNFKQHLDFVRRDELALLAQTLNESSDSIADMQTGLENRIAIKTKELRHNNTTLNYLFTIASKINGIHEKEIDIPDIITTLSTLIDIKQVELCLLTPDGDKPYQQTTIDENNPCIAKNCDECRAPIKTIKRSEGITQCRYPVMHGSEQLGVIAVSHEDKKMEAWKDQLIQSVADQIAIALSIKKQANNMRRMALMNERSVIARELHDSLAQALSYLQIQVTRLQKNQDKGSYEKHQAVIDELREGLSSAYLSLRELLTTFRLKISAEGLKSSLEETISQLQSHTPISIELNYEVQDIPMSPAEEVHLVQIVREATQNAIKHSKGSLININFSQQNNRVITVFIEDNGVGLPSNTDKIHHYGMAIMKERSHQLGGDISVKNRKDGGTRVEFNFTPTIISKSA